MKKKKYIELTKSFMEEHGERKSAMKVSWDEYISTLNKKENQK